MRVWAEIWRCHGLEQLERPPDLLSWDPLPPLTVDMLKAAALSFPVSTAIGPARIGMRALVHLSDIGVYVAAALFTGWHVA